MADLSNVDSFLALCDEEVGREGSEVFGLRGPGRLPFDVGPIGADAATLGTDFAFNGSDDPGTEMDASSSGGCHSGHFLASTESSGTSTTSL